MLATHTPAFTVGEGVELIPVGELVQVTEPPSGFTMLGAGKTAMDACSFLLDNDVAPDKIRWVRPRDAWLMNRSSWQPLDLVASTIESLSLVLQCLAEAENLDVLFGRLEACGALLRLDPAVEPTMFRGAIVSPAEQQSLKQIEGVIRQGRVRRIEADRIVLPPTAYPSQSIDWISVFASGFRVITQMLHEPDLAAWLGTCRLNTTRGMNDHIRDPRMQAALGRWFENMAPALANAQRLRTLTAS